MGLDSSAKMAGFAVTWEDTELQADLTMGNLASALTLQSDEAALVEELRAGSEEAFAWLIARYHQPIFSLLARTVRNSRRRRRPDPGSLRQSLPRSGRFSWRVVAAHLDLSHRLA